MAFSEVHIGTDRSIFGAHPIDVAFTDRIETEGDIRRLSRRGETIWFGLSPRYPYRWVAGEVFNEAEMRSVIDRTQPERKTQWLLGWFLVYHKKIAEARFVTPTPLRADPLSYVFAHVNEDFLAPVVPIYSGGREVYSFMPSPWRLSVPQFPQLR